MPEFTMELWFCLGVFTLLQAAIWIVFLRLQKMKDTKRKDEMPNLPKLKESEAKLLQLYGELEDMMDAFEEYINEVREDIEQERAQLTDLSRQAATVYMRGLAQASDPNAAPPPASAPPAATERAPYSQEGVNTPPAETPRIIRPVSNGDAGSRLTSKDREELRRFSSKAQKVRFLMSRGLSLEEVARELDIGKGEVKLIAELQK